MVPGTVCVFSPTTEQKRAGCWIWRGRMDLYQDNRSPVGLYPRGFVVVFTEEEGRTRRSGKGKHQLSLFVSTCLCMLHLYCPPACSYNFPENGTEAAVLTAVSLSLTTPKRHGTPEEAGTSRTSIWNEPLKMWRTTTVKWLSLKYPEPPEEPPWVGPTVFIP